jgi:hypothetical protein
MKTTSLLSLFLALAAPAFGTSIPSLLNPIPLNAPGTFTLYPENNTTYVSAYGVTSSCETGAGPCQLFDFLGIWNGGHLTSAGLGGDYGLTSGGVVFQGTLFNTVFNSSTGELTGHFSGVEMADDNGISAFYLIKGTFSEKLTFTSTSGGTLGGGSLNITSSTYVGPVLLPEPGTLGLMGTGLVGIVGAMRRKLTRG